MTKLSLKAEIKSLITNRIEASEIKENNDHLFFIEPWDKNSFAAVVPAPLAEMFNYTFPTEAEAWAWIVTAREMHPDGKNWGFAPSDKENCAKCLYELLGDVCINDNEEIEDDFLHFDQGTDRTEIWHWIESEFDVSVAELEGVA